MSEKKRKQHQGKEIDRVKKTPDSCFRRRLWRRFYHMAIEHWHNLRPKAQYLPYYCKFPLRTSRAQLLIVRLGKRAAQQGKPSKPDKSVVLPCAFSARMI